MTTLLHADPWPHQRDPNYLSPHCASGSCAFCRERRARARAKLDAELRIKQMDLFRDVGDWSYWQRPLEAGPADVLGYHAPVTHQGTPPRPWDRGIRYLHEPRQRNQVGQLRRTVRAVNPWRA